MKKIGILIISALVLGLVQSASAAPLFPDLSEQHWARDAVRSLAAKGIIEGYPDGTFKGDRAASRFETALMVARLLAAMERTHATFATKAELNEVRKLAEAYREELNAIGVRVTNLEEDVSLLDKRVNELERITFYGRMSMASAFQNVHGPNNVGTAANPGIDWRTGRLLLSGTGFTSLGLLGVNVEVTDDLDLGAEFAAFVDQGNLGVSSYWGLSAPYQTNFWAAQGSAAGGVQPDNRQPFTRMVLDNFWLHHKPSDTRATVGSYLPTYLAPFVLNGAKNPNIHQPEWIPFNGANVTGTIGGKDSGWKYEVFYSILPERSLYNTHTHGGVVQYQFKDNNGFVGLNFARTQNERISDGIIQAANLIPIPSVLFTGPGAPPVSPSAWIDRRTNTPRATVGPQSENTFGGEFQYLLHEDANLRIKAEYAHSDYNPDRTRTNFRTNVTGNMFKLGLSATPIEGLDLAAAYTTVDPTYDPFLVQYPLGAGVPVFVPFGAYYPAYYQLHDYTRYPNNREGFKFDGSYVFNDNKSGVFLNFSTYDQKKATTPGQVGTVGNIEPLFSLLQGGGRQRGNLDSYRVGGFHTFDNDLRINLAYQHFDIQRGGPRIDQIDLGQDVIDANLTYPITEDLELHAGVTFLDFKGRNGLLNTDFSQTIPNIGVEWQMEENTRVNLDWRYFDLHNDLVPVASYSGNQVLMEVNLDF